MLMVQYYGAGVQACYRGPRLYDTTTTQALVSKTVSWYKKYRDILNAPLVHLRRADGRDWDGFMHVSPTLKDRAFLLLFNPTAETIQRQVVLPLYYTGLNTKVDVAEKDAIHRQLLADAQGNLKLNVSIPAGSYTWYLIRKTN
jgi:hypothetical protein